MTEQERVLVELQKMQDEGLAILRDIAFRWMENAAGRGLGKQMQPHQRANARRIGQRALNRYYAAIDQIVKSNTDLPVWKKDTKSTMNS